MNQEDPGGMEIRNPNNFGGQEIRIDLNKVYYSNLGVIQFFKAIDSQIQKMRSETNISVSTVQHVSTQLTSSLPTLKNLKYEIGLLDTTNFSEVNKDKINKHIHYITNTMDVSEVEQVSDKFFQLLKDSEAAVKQEKERIAEAEEERKAKEERERREREEAARKAEAERRTKEERERREREEAVRKAEAERKAKEEREKKEKTEAERKAKEEQERNEREAARKAETEQREKREKLGIANYLGKSVLDYEVQSFFKEFGIYKDKSLPYTYSNENGAISIGLKIDYETIHEIRIYVTSNFIGETWGKYKSIVFPNNIYLWDTIEKIEQKIQNFVHATIDDDERYISYFYDTLLFGQKYQFHLLVNKKTNNTVMIGINL